MRKPLSHTVVSNQKTAWKETCGHILVSLHMKLFFSTMVKTQVSYMLTLCTGHLNPTLSLQVISVKDFSVDMNETQSKFSYIELHIELLV